MQPREDMKTVPYASASLSGESGIFSKKRFPTGGLFALLAILAALVVSGGVYMISREAQFRRIQGDVEYLEEEVEDLKAKQRQFETQDMRMQTQIENIQDAN